MKTTAAKVEARMTATAATGLVTITLVTLAMSALSPTTLLPMPFPVLLPLPSHLSACNKGGDDKGSKSNGDSNGDGNK
jgi:hypothetical protein